MTPDLYLTPDLYRDARSLSEAARLEYLHEGVTLDPGRFGPSRKEEAAARRADRF